MSVETLERWEDLRVYARELADLMGLRDWQFAVDDETPPDGNHNAEVETPYGRRYATLRFSDYFWASSPEDQRATVTHELIHCHLESVVGPVRDDLREYIGSVGDMLFWAQFKRQMEYAVDNIAVAWAQHHPLPPWARKRTRGKTA